MNGQPPVSITHGTTTIDLPVGTYDLGIAVYCEEIPRLRYGQASIQVTVLPQSSTIVYYNAPWMELGRGRIGLTPQPKWFVNLRPLLLWGLAVPLVIVVAIVTGLVVFT